MVRSAPRGLARARKKRLTTRLSSCKQRDDDPRSSKESVAKRPFGACKKRSKEYTYVDGFTARNRRSMSSPPQSADASFAPCENRDQVRLNRKESTEMEKTLLTGNEAIARGAYEANASVATGYPGTPSTEILENVSKFYKDDVYCEWAPNEKVAFEAAVGAHDRRAMTTMKLSSASTSPPTAHDPSLHRRQGRFYRRRRGRPRHELVAERAGHASLRAFRESTRPRTSGFPGSERFRESRIRALGKFRAPVILRTTVTVSHSRSVVETADPIALNRVHSFEAIRSASCRSPRSPESCA